MVQDEAKEVAADVADKVDEMKETGAKYKTAVVGELKKNPSTILEDAGKRLDEAKEATEKNLRMGKEAMEEKVEEMKKNAKEELEEIKEKVAEKVEEIKEKAAKDDGSAARVIIIQKSLKF